MNEEGDTLRAFGTVGCHGQADLTLNAAGTSVVVELKGNAIHAALGSVSFLASSTATFVGAAPTVQIQKPQGKVVEIQPAVERDEALPIRVVRHPPSEGKYTQRIAMPAGSRLLAFGEAFLPGKALTVLKDRIADMREDVCEAEAKGLQLRARLVPYSHMVTIAFDPLLWLVRKILGLFDRK